MADKRHCPVRMYAWQGSMEEVVAGIFQAGDSSPSVSLNATWLSHPLFFSLLSSHGKKQLNTGGRTSTMVHHFVPPLFPPSGEDGWTGWDSGWAWERKRASINHLTTPWVKERLEVTQERGQHTQDSHTQKAKVLWALGALPLCLISPGVLLQLQLCWAGTIPMCVCLCVIQGVCLVVTGKTQPIDQWRRQESWVSRIL